MTLDDIKGLADAIRGEVAKAIVGHDALVSRMLVALFSGGHILLEGPPGTAKTLLAQSFAASLGLDFGRIQFTPDLMPGDILGSNLFNFQTSKFSLTKGPIFSELLLADEINRTPPKTQAALLQAMQERTVTIDGVAHSLSPRFTVIATQNPIEQQGVYPLPEAQLDRFLFKLLVEYPDAAQERQIVRDHAVRFDRIDPRSMKIKPVVNDRQLHAAAATIGAVRLDDSIIDYVVNLVRATRENPSLSSGASPRAATALARAAAAAAALDGRDYVVPDDVQQLAPDVLRHRLVLSPAAEIDGRDVDTIVDSLVTAVAAPR